MTPAKVELGRRLFYERALSGNGTYARSSCHRQDLAFTVPEDVSAGDLVNAAKDAAGEPLREMRAFDVYRGDQVGPGRKSIAFSVTCQSPERTLTDEDAAELRKRIVERLQDAVGAQLRA